jgi:enamine deaminase RidA (YjgF/YER057c/UK114 family)
VKRIVALACSLVACACAHAAEVIRHKIPNSDFPIAQAVEIPSGQSLVFLSGAGPDVADKNAPKDSPAVFGDMKTQTASTLSKIDATLKSMGLTMKDVVKMQAFLVGDPQNGDKIDFAGFMDGYKKYFGTADQPNLPARSAFKVAGLAVPGWLIEIEVTAVRAETNKK